MCVWHIYMLWFVLKKPKIFEKEAIQQKVTLDVASKIIRLNLYSLLTLHRMGLFGAAHGCGGEEGGGQKGPLPKICHTYPTMRRLDTVIPYLKKIKKIHK